MDFFDKYDPDVSVKSENFADEGEEGQFETFGADYDHVLEVFKATPLRVWTMIDDDESDHILIVNGLRTCNRIAYLITVQEGRDGERYFI